MNTYLDIVTTENKIHYLSTYFVTKLRQDKKWSLMQRWFATSYRPELPHRPRIDCPTILIPCHVNNCHWVAIVRRIIHGRITFLYADDMNHEPTEMALRALLRHHTDDEFYPSSAQWIKCHSTTYSPHSNECGLRTLLALIILGLHPDPDEFCLAPFMSGNLAQISRYWAAATLLRGRSIVPNLSVVPNRHSPVRVSHSTPFSLAPWPDLQGINPPYSSQLELSPAINQRTHKVNQTPISYQSSIPTNEPSRERSSFPSGQQRHSSNNQITSRLKSQDEPPAKLQLSPRFVTTSRKYSEENRIEDHILPADVSQVTTILPNLGPKEETKTKPTNSGQERKDSRWHQKPKLKQTTIRKFVVTQPSLYDFNFLKPHKQASREDPDNWGHVMESIDPQHTVRLLLQNPNGIQPHISYSDFLFGLHISESL